MNRDFKGIWIPKNIWFIKELKPAYRVFLAEIDSLDNGEGCSAKNKHFSIMFGLSTNRCSEIIKMLSDGDFITISYNDNNGVEQRILNVNTPFGKSNPPSVSRLTPSVSRLTPSTFRLPNIKDLEIHIETRERGALFFLNQNYPSRFEQEFEMRYASQIKNLKKFCLDFDDTITDEKKAFDDALFGRLGKYARNWIENQDRFSKEEESTNQKHNFGEAI